VTDIFDDLALIRLASESREVPRAAFVATISALPVSVRGTDVGLLYDIVAASMNPSAFAPDGSDDLEAMALLHRYEDAIETAGQVIRATMTAVAAKTKNRKKYVTDVRGAAEGKATLLYSVGHGQPTAAQPWLEWKDHVIAAAFNETGAATPEAHKIAAARAYYAVMILTGLLTIVGDDGVPLGDVDRVRVVANLLKDVSRAKAPGGPRGPAPDFTEGFRIVRAVCEYRVRQGLPVAVHSKTKTDPWAATPDTTNLLRAVAVAWGIDINPTQLGDLVRQHLKRVHARVIHGQRADAKYIDWHNLGVLPPK
jgi:hypothetical protein